MQFNDCIKCSQKVAWSGIIVNTLLFIMKISIGLMSGSKALVADSLYSLKDIATAVVIIISLKISHKEIDAEHPYGHGKVEFIATLLISLFLIASSMYLFTMAVDDIMNNPHDEPPHFIAIIAALVSVLVNIYLYKFTRCVAFQSNSPLIKTVSFHNQADALSSSLVVIALAGTHIGLLLLDPIVAVIETLHLSILSIILLKDSYEGLMDKALPEETNNLIEKITRKVKGVTSIQKMRTRQIGQNLSIDLIIGVNPTLTINEAKEVAEVVEEDLLVQVPHTATVLVHFVSHKEDEKEQEKGAILQEPEVST
ncbi:MAG: cation transporter [Nitrospinae bacterium]|nr:cation transporter [Nitrospinota bacterium]